MDFKYIVSVIVPVYNVENYLRDCLDSLVNQTMRKDTFEILLIDDGSTDSSPEICDEYVRKFDNFKVFHIKNGGVSAARNFGIDKSAGKYIMFLDSDDYLSKNSIKKITTFFDSHYEETDVVTYAQMIDREGVLKKSAHFRYRYIQESGIYDLTDPDYMFFLQTHMNICIKNRMQDNIKFDTSMIFHEDQNFILSNLKDKNKIGFCAEAVYYYVQNTGGATSTHSHPYFIFEKTMEMWEKFFAADVIPKYIQAFFLHDFHWKLRADLLWPYHYKGNDFERAVDRIVALIKQVDDDVILNFPGMIKPHIVYILELKYGSRMKVTAGEDGYQICRDDEPLLEMENVEIYVSRFQVKNNFLTMIGVIKCLAGNFTDDIRLSVTCFGEKTEKEYAELRRSSLSICASRTQTNNFKMFVIQRKIEQFDKMDFAVEILGRKYPVHFTYPAACPFNRGLKREAYICEDLYIKCKESSILFLKSNCLNRFHSILKNNVARAPKIGYRNALIRTIAPGYKKRHRIWLYCDSSKTVKDNAYYQFLHDVKKEDGIMRYYVYNPEKDVSDWFAESMKGNLLAYGSVKHRLCGLSAEKIITSFYGLRDILSYPYGAVKYFSDLTNFDVIYLQHGVLHANLPTMYSLDRMMLNKEVISTPFEEENLTENYCFDERFLIKSGMPRYDHIDKDKQPEKKILFAPSWRKFLVRSDGKGNWLPNEGAFLNSDFYKNTIAFLTDPKLKKVLKENGYVLDFKLHPNFKMYADCYDKLDGEIIRLAGDTVDEFSYSLFMTDFSSFVFDFVYLKRPILYFVPDMNLFEAGMNHYRRLDLNFEDGFGAVSADGEKAVSDVIEIIQNNCEPEEKYIKRMDNFFLPVDDHEEALYRALMSEES